MSIQENGESRQTLINAVRICNAHVLFDKIAKLSSLRWLLARLTNETERGVQSATHPDLFFLRGRNQSYFSGDDLQAAADVIVSYKNYCDSLGVQFLFVPLPNKETVYFDLVPFDLQPDYLLRLDALLSEAGVPTLNTLRILNAARRSGSGMLYHLDDTHWNANATAVLAKEIVRALGM